MHKPMGDSSHLNLNNALPLSLNSPFLTYSSKNVKVQIATPLPGLYPLLLAHTMQAHIHEALSHRYLLLPTKNTGTNGFLLRRISGTFLTFNRQCLCLSNIYIEIPKDFPCTQQGLDCCLRIQTTFP